MDPLKRVICFKELLQLGFELPPPDAWFFRIVQEENCHPPHSLFGVPLITFFHYSHFYGFIKYLLLSTSIIIKTQSQSIHRDDARMIKSVPNDRLIQKNVLRHHSAEDRSDKLVV